LTSESLEEAKMQKWEYTFVREHGGVVQQINEQQVAKGFAIFGFGKYPKSYDVLNKFGMEGWELVGMGQDTSQALIFVLKRLIT
jgi:hypothetical protein